MSGPNKQLGMAYNTQRKAKKMSGSRKVGCMDCMSKGGKCMAHGGVVNEEMSIVSKDPAKPEQKKGGSVVSEILGDRQKMAKGGLVDAGVEPDFHKRVDLEPVHTVEDDEHDIESGSKDDEELVGQILRERKMRRR